MFDDDDDCSTPKMANEKLRLMILFAVVRNNRRTLDCELQLLFFCCFVAVDKLLERKKKGEGREGDR